ncbi:MAG: C69 family dipeptidase [Candidatus Krumholzibacteriota bacterium]|nr:C69 family dipeptidase [Candidatus Krumholzibacteriota bacterium]
MRTFMSLRGRYKARPAALAVFCVLLSALPVRAGTVREYPEGCTTVTVGRLASTDGSVMTSHTCDGHDGRTWLDIVPHRKHSRGAWTPVYGNSDFMTAPFDTAGMRYTGSLPLPAETFGYIYAIYPPMNEHQLAIGESTFGGKEELKSDQGIINCYELTRIMAARCKTAREAIKLAGELLEKYGYNDEGECLTIADKKEVWHLEIVGPGQGKVGAIWAARRVPDDHVSVNANGSRIRQLDLKNKDFFMASRNVFSAAEEMGYWDPRGGRPFEFCYAYASRKSMWARRREWRVLDLMAPSLELDPNGENFPFSVKPEKKVSVADMQRLFADTYEDTDYDMTKFMLITDEEGKRVKSPYANPFMNYDQMPLWKINGGLGLYGERTIARYYCIYVFITQSRDWLPDPVGGIVWLGWDNPAMTCYAPLYCGITRVPDCYRMGGKGGRPAYSRESAWWGVNRVSTIAAHRWGDMRHDVAAVRDPIHETLFAEQKRIEDEALRLFSEDPRKAVDYLTKYSNDWCTTIDRAYWKLGDDLWTKYDEKF